MTTISIFVRAMDGDPLDYIALVCHGITYVPTETAKVNDLHKHTFLVETDADTTTPTLGISVSESIRTSERMG